MIELNGKYATAKVFTDNIESEAISQIIELCNQEFANGANVRIMPDTHAGKGCVIGFTMNIQDKIVPNLVGVDIGCGMHTTLLGMMDIDLKELDDYINNNIPSGFNINKNPKVHEEELIESLRCFREIPKSSREFNRAIGTLGGGNHFIEVNMDSAENKYLVIHSGSRNLGHQVAIYYQNKAFDYHNGLDDEFELKKKALIKEYKDKGRRKEIQNALKKLTKECMKVSKLPKDLCYLEGQLMDDYLHDMKIVQGYANLNRETMARRIVEECFGFDFSKLYKFQTIHNYINMEDNVLRKGAISANYGEDVLIPINMRDGSLLCVGKGNEDWNNSAPHGAGRLMSRSKAKDTLSMDDFEESMKDVYTTSVMRSTLDEAPMAYKPIEEIIANVEDTVEIIDIIKPIYNYKAH